MQKKDEERQKSFRRTKEFGCGTVSRKKKKCRLKWEEDFFFNMKKEEEGKENGTGEVQKQIGEQKKERRGKQEADSK